MPRQGKNIYLRKDGRWEGRYQKDKTDGKTKYCYVFGKTYEETELKLDAVKAELKLPKSLSTKIIIQTPKSDCSIRKIPILHTISSSFARLLFKGQSKNF